MSEQEILDSWILHSLRDTIEDKNVRNNILKRNLSPNNDIVYGETINAFDDETAYIREITKIARKAKKLTKKYYLFTISNLYDANSYETHFQTFIYQRTSTTLYTIEPSKGLYADYAIQYTVDIFKKELPDVKVKKVEMSNTCQKDENDVFCQSWSLYVQILKMKKLLRGDTTKISISSDDKIKFSKLLQFYKENIDLICNKLNENFNLLVDTNELQSYLDKKESTSTKKILKKYKNKVCDRIENDWTYESLL